jgi:hypothetical protein
VEPISSAVSASAAKLMLEQLFKYAPSRLAAWMKDKKNHQIASTLSTKISTIGKVKTLVHTDNEVHLADIYYSRLGERDLQSLFEAFCFSTRQDELTELSAAQLHANT